MTRDLQITRIENKFNTLFTCKVDMSDSKFEVDSDEYHNAFLSRCVAATAIQIICGIDIDDAVKCIVDGYKDYGIDAIYRDENSKKLILLQAKWIKNGIKSIEKGDFLKFIEGVEKIINLDFTNCNSKIKSKIPDIEYAIKEMDYHIEVVLSYTGNQKLSDECTESLNKLINKINDDDSELIVSTTLKKQQLYDFFSSNQTGMQIDIDDVVLEDWGNIDEQDLPVAYYGVISAEQIANWWNKHGLKLFEKNIRFFKGSTEVNDGIKHTLQNEPEKFYYYNNGIKVLTQKVTRKAAHSSERKIGLFSLKKMSIVNGAQTVGCIGETFNNFPEQVKKAKISIQIISLENIPVQYGEQITKLSNTQNRIESKDFISMDSEQERLQKDLFIDGISYTYKSGSTIVKSETACHVDEATISLGCMYSDISISTTLKRAYGSIFDDLTKAPYKLIFNGGVTSYNLWNSVQIMRYAEKLNLSMQATHSGKKKLVLIHGNRFLLHMLFDALKLEIYDLKHEKIDVSKIQNIIKTTYSQQFKKCCLVVDNIYPDAYPANIFKNNSRCIKIKDSMKK